MALKDWSVEKVLKIRKFCRMFRIVIGVILIALGIYTHIIWFYLGIVPLLAGIFNFCPLCAITKKCDIV